jgi:hypothetical protein
MNINEKLLWRNSWLKSINELTSFNLQKESWLNCLSKNQHYSFIEFMSCYFDDLLIDDNYKIILEKGWISDKEYEIIKTWHSELDKYEPPKNDDFDNDSIINDPKWQEIINIGLNVKEELSKIINESENKILAKDIKFS